MEVKKLKCLRCGYSWFPTISRDGKIKLPIACANHKCRSIYWNKKKHLFNTPKKK